MQAYLRRAVMNRLRDEIRRVDRRPHAVELDSGLTAAGPSPLEDAIGSQALARYEAALSRLGQEERAAVVARVEMRSSYQQIAAELGKPSPDAARMMVTRALLRLAEEMADGE
jgi:RNA polymerase sigma-70 factor (ECF subfamily)